MTENNIYSPYNSEEELLKAMCIHKAGHILAFYYAFSPPEDFDFSQVDLDKYYESNKTQGVETVYKQFPNYKDHKKSIRDYSFNKYSFYERWICCHLGGGFCKKHLENLSKLPECGMGENLRKAKDNDSCVAYNTPIYRFDNDSCQTCRFG